MSLTDGIVKKILAEVNAPPDIMAALQKLLAEELDRRTVEITVRFPRKAMTE